MDLGVVEYMRLNSVCLTSGGDVILQCVNEDYVWRHEYKLPSWCSGLFGYSVDHVIRLIIPIYYEGGLRKLCIEVEENKLRSYSTDKLSWLINEVINDLKDLRSVTVSMVLKNMFKTLINYYHEHLTKLDIEIEVFVNKIMKGATIYRPIYNLYSHASKLHRGVHGLIYGLQRLEIRYNELSELLSEAIMLENMYSSSIDRITQAFNLYYTLIGERTNRVVTKLTVISAIFLPLTLIAGIYGMNFKYMPELQHPLAYPLTLMAMAIIALGELVYFRRKGWI